MHYHSIRIYNEAGELWFSKLIAMTYSVNASSNWSNTSRLWRLCRVLCFFLNILASLGSLKGTSHSPKMLIPLGYFTITDFTYDIVV